MLVNPIVNSWQYRNNNCQNNTQKNSRNTSPSFGSYASFSSDATRELGKLTHCSECIDEIVRVAEEEINRITQSVGGSIDIDSTREAYQNTSQFLDIMYSGQDGVIHSRLNAEWIASKIGDSEKIAKEIVGSLDNSYKSNYYGHYGQKVNKIDPKGELVPENNPFDVVYGRESK